LGFLDSVGQLEDEVALEDLLGDGDDIAEEGRGHGDVLAGRVGVAWSFASVLETVGAMKKEGLPPGWTGRAAEQPTMPAVETDG
jgi:hypothetical protein